MRGKVLCLSLGLMLGLWTPGAQAHAADRGEFELYEAAGLICHAAVTQARSLGVPVAVWVLDQAGQPVMMQKMEGALLPAVEAAYNKAWTCAALHAESGDLPGLIEQGDLAGLVQDERIMPFGGGVPITDERGYQLGAIGVAGASPEQDREIAAAALKTIGKSLDFS